MDRSARNRCALVLASVVALACGPTASLPLTSYGRGTSEPGLMDEGAVAEESSSSSSSGGGSSTSGVLGSSSSGTGLGFSGPGCAPPPACDRGELEGSISIRSGTEIEQFTGYTSVTGWLEINGSDLECLTFLLCLESVGHDIDIFGNPALLTLHGTDAIVGIGVRTLDRPPYEKDGSVVIAENPALTDVDGFNGLQKVEQSLIVADHDDLTAISGFSGLEWVVFDLVVTRNPLLEDVSGLEGLRALENQCQVNHNESLCMSDVFAVCGDLEVGGDEGNTQYNKAGC